MAERRRKRTYRILKHEPPAVELTSEQLEALALELYKRPRQVLISEAAYYRSSCRGDGEGDPVADWLAAEKEIDALLAQHSRSNSRSNDRSQT
jgi:hypothetical protein